MLEDNIARVPASIDALTAYPNGKITRDEETGRTLPDLRRAVVDLLDCDLAALAAPVQSLGIARDRERMKVCFRTKLLPLERHLQAAQSRNRAAQDTLNRYMQAASGAAPQLGARFLDQLMSLARQSTDEKYRQGLSDMIFQFAAEAAAVERDILGARTFLDGLAGPAPDAEKAGRYIALFEQGVPATLAILRGHVESVYRIRTALGMEQLSYGGALYRTAGAAEMDAARRVKLGVRDLLL